MAEGFPVRLPKTVFVQCLFFVSSFFIGLSFSKNYSQIDLFKSALVTQNNKLQLF